MSENEPMKRKPINSTTPTCIEICSGAGGQALGLEMAGFEGLAHVENDRHACATLRQNRPGWNVFEGDVRGFSAKQSEGVEKGTTRAVACCLRRPRRKRGSNLLAASTQYPNAVQTLNPATGQRGRSPEHAAARVLPTGFAADLLGARSFTATFPEASIPNSKQQLDTRN